MHKKLTQLFPLFPLSAIAVMSSLVMSSAHADVDTTFTFTGKIMPAACALTAPVAINLGDIVASGSSSSTAIRSLADGSIGKLYISCVTSRKFLLSMDASTSASALNNGAPQISGAGEESYKYLHANAPASQADYGAGLEPVKGLGRSTAAGVVSNVTVTGERTILSQHSNDPTRFLAIVDSTSASTVAAVKAASLDLTLDAYYTPDQVTSEVNINDVHSIRLTYL